MTDLCRLAAKYGTDKIYYTPFYDLLFRGRRGLVTDVLEIGIGTPSAMSHVPGYKPGASLRMWEEYFPKAFICGMDKDASVLFETERIFTFQADQSQPDSYNAARYGPFDLIVDDGSHNTADQLLTVEKLLPCIRKGGLYIIEDVNQPEELIAKLKVPCTYVRVHHGLEGRCVVINA